ncbi:MAG: divergent polysaccharide deacetylase family protein [Pseudomonadota bacterium]
MKGFLKGGLWGLVLGGAGLSFASLVGEQPNFAEGPSAPQLSVPTLDTVAPGPTVAFEGSGDESPAFTPAAPLDQATEVTEAAPEVSTEPAALPQTADIDAAIEEPDVALGADLGSSIDAPTAPREETALVAPNEDANAPVVDTAPAAVQTETPTEEAPDAVVVEEAAEPVEEVAEDAPPAVDVTEATPAPIVVEEESVVEAPEPAETPDEPRQPEVVVVAPADEDEVPETEVAQEPVTPAEPETTEQTADVTADAVGETPQQDTAVVTETLPQTNTAVRINRPVAEEDPVVEVAEAPVADAIPDDAPALLRNAVPFTVDQDTALITILLVDDGQMADAPAALAELGIAATVAVNALSSASTDLAAAYRAAGVEVAMQAALPEGAQPADVEVAFEAALGLVPEAALLFSDGTGAMQDRAVTAQVMEILAAEGHGLVSVQRGLSNAARAAEQAGVPAATVERDIDGDGQDGRAVLRSLDQAAFRARQTGQAVLVGRVNPDTLDALRSWAADIDRDTLAIAPVSAVLLRDQ